VHQRATWTVRAIWCLFAIGASCLTPTLARSQTATATLSGTVVDQSGAAVPEVVVTLINASTAIDRPATTNSQGAFTFPFVAPGRYTLRAQRDGFAPAQFEDIVMNVGDDLVLRLALRVGNVTESVSVVADVRTASQSGGLATRVDRQFVENLPLNGRTFQPLLQLTPGLVVTSAINGLGGFSVNGQRESSNSFTVDGVSANVGVTAGNVTVGGGGQFGALSALGTTGGLVTQDAMQEVTVHTSNFAPEFGRTPGAQVSIVTRSGTNQFTGSAFELFRDDAFDANDWFANRLGLPKPPLRQHQFGAVVGGPFIRDRSFFFGSYEGLQLDLPRVATAQLPTMDARNRAIPPMRTLLEAMPVPNGRDLGNGFAEHAASWADPSRSDVFSLRLDQRLTAGSTLFARYSREESTSDSRLATVLSSTQVAATTLQTLTAGSTTAFTGRLLNDVRVNWSRPEGKTSFVLNDLDGAVPLPREALCLTFDQCDGAWLAYTVRGGTNPAVTTTNLANNVQRQVQVIDTLSMSVPGHDLRFGIDYRQLTPTFAVYRSLQNYTFATLDDALAGRASVSVTNPTGHQLTFVNFSAFAQDSWRLHPALTLTYGVRWELNPPPKSRNGVVPSVLTQADDLATAQLAPSGTPVWETSYTNFAPRVGAAYQMSNDERFGRTIRGGVGVFYDMGPWVSSGAFSLGSSSFSLPSVQYPVSPQLVAPRPPSSAPPYAIGGVDPALTLPYTVQWNATIDQSLGASRVLTLAYVGAAGRRLYRTTEYLPPPSQLFRSLSLTDNGSRSDYRALQAQFRQQLSRGMRALVSYTWGQAQDDISREGLTFAFTPNDGAIDLDYGPSDFDIRHTFSGAFGYIAEGVGGTLGTIVNGLSVDVLVRARSAPPINVSTRITGSTFTNGPRIRPDVVEGVPVWVDDTDAPGGQRLNRAAFVSRTTTHGSLGRNALRGFGASQIDVALGRYFALPGRVRVQARVEAFNVLNQANFGPPQHDLANAQFGRSTMMLSQSLTGLSALYQIGGPRSVQLGLKVLF
jgi:hypothetical protein